MGRDAEFFDITGCDAGDHFDVANPSGDERLIRRRPGPQGAIDVFGKIIDHPVADAEIDVHIWKFLMKIAERRHDNPVGKGAGHFDTQASAGCALRIGKTFVQLSQFRNDLDRSLIIQGPVRRHHDATGGPVEQLGLQMGFQPWMRLVTVAFGISSRSAARVKLPVSTTRIKARIAESWSMGVGLIDVRCTIIRKYEQCSKKTLACSDWRITIDFT